MTWLVVEPDEVQYVTLQTVTIPAGVLTEEGQAIKVWFDPRWDYIWRKESDEQA